MAWRGWAAPPTAVPAKAVAPGAMAWRRTPARSPSSPAPASSAISEMSAGQGSGTSTKR